MKQFISFFIAFVILLNAFGIANVNADSEPKDHETSTPIKHFLIIMQENHTFDNYFGTYPGANGFPPGTKMPVDPDDPNTEYVEWWGRNH